MAKWLLLFVFLPCFAQKPLPNAPGFFTKTEISLISQDLSARALDWSTTQQFLRMGYSEGQLPQSLVENKPLFAVYEAGVVTGVTAVSYLCYRHNHRKLGWVIQAGEIAAVSFTVKHNYELIGTPIKR